VAAGLALEEYARCCDSLTCCLSKALSAPVGSLIVGDGEFIERARRFRKMMGGGMRQAGYLAACGLYALDHLVERLADDHRRARRLAEGLAEIPGFEIDPESVETNILMVQTAPGEAPQIAAALERREVRTISLGPAVLRFVTHRHIEDEHVERAITAAQELGV
jgi:threonine aldolase